MVRKGFAICFAVLSVAVSAPAQESDDAVEHTGYVWTLSTRGGVDQEPDSTYFVFCREKVSLPTYGQCQVVWLSGGADITVGTFARVKGEPSSVTQKELSELRRLVLGEAYTAEELATLREYFDIVNAHQLIRLIGYGERPGLLDRFDVLSYIRAEQAIGIKKK
jgi:hypothetical protein